MKKFLIDLDGVLNNYGTNKFDENYIPEMRDGVEEFLKELSCMGKLYLFTTRNLKLSTQWLIDNRIDKYFKDITNVKIPAYLHINDRAICFSGDYKITIDNVKKFKVYWKKNEA
ncbi:hypothetical protein J6P92_01800 [bacterium]|nr:hypothetical protein [bacterium]